MLKDMAWTVALIAVIAACSVNVLASCSRPN